MTIRRSIFVLLTLLFAGNGWAQMPYMPAPGGPSMMMPGPGAYGQFAPQVAMPMAPYGMQPSFAAAPVAPVSALSSHDACKDCSDKSCDKCCDCWCHQFIAFGEFLYLRARDAEVAYGVAIDGPIVGPPTNNPIQIDRVGVVDQDWDTGFRAGFGYVLDGWSSLTISWTMFETDRFDQINTTAPDVIRSLVSHPGSSSAATDFLSGSGFHFMSYDLADVDYRSVLVCNDAYEAVLLLGARYANLEQQLTATFVAAGSETVTTDIDFDGVGVRIGLEGERYSRSRRFLVYAKTSASLIPGEFRADYRQSQTFDPTVVDTNWRAGRIVPIFDLELGAGWTSKCRTWRLSAGYSMSAWTNTVKTDDWINAVQRNNFLDLGDTMTFDGLIARVEGRF